MPWRSPAGQPAWARPVLLAVAANAPALTRAAERLELQTPPGDALFGTDTSGLAQNYILYSGREVLRTDRSQDQPPGQSSGHVQHPVPAYP
jgi:hypothetical protein